MKDVTVIAIADRLWEGQDRKVQEAVEEAINTIATGLMHMYEAKSVNVALGRLPLMPTVIKMEFQNCKDPDFLSESLASTMLTVAMIGAHSRATESVLDQQKVMETPLEKLYPEDKDLFKAQEGGEQ